MHSWHLLDGHTDEYSLYEPVAVAGTINEAKNSFGPFAALPPLGVSARMGEEGVRWQRLAQGVFRRQLRLVEEKVSFARGLPKLMKRETCRPLLEVSSNRKNG